MNVKPGMELFRKADHGYQKVKVVADYNPGFPAVRVRTLDAKKLEWLVKPSEILTVEEKQIQDEKDYVNRFPDVIKAWNDGAVSRKEISASLCASYGQVRKVVKLALKHRIIKLSSWVK